MSVAGYPSLEELQAAITETMTLAALPPKPGEDFDAWRARLLEPIEKTFVLAGQDLRAYQGLLWVDEQDKKRLVYVVYDPTAPHHKWKLYESHPASGPVCLQSYRRLAKAVEKALIEANVMTETK